MRIFSTLLVLNCWTNFFGSNQRVISDRALGWCSSHLGHVERQIPKTGLLVSADAVPVGEGSFERIKDST